MLEVCLASTSGKKNPNLCLVQPSPNFHHPLVLLCSGERINSTMVKKSVTSLLHLFAHQVKGCFATRLNHIHDTPTGESDAIAQEQFLLPSKSTSSFQLGPSSDPAAGNSKRKSKVHECSICHRIFSSGQALGGHKRCHWITSNSPETFQKLNKYDQLDLSLVPARSDDLTGIRRDPRNLLSFEVSTEINLHSWVDVDTDGENNNYKTLDNNINDNNMQSVNSEGNVEDEADSKVKLAKLSELKDLKMSGDSSGWLQVGIGSTTGVGAVDP